MKKTTVGRFTVQVYKTGEIVVLQHPTKKNKPDFYGFFPGKLRMNQLQDFEDLKACINNVDFK